MHEEKLFGGKISKSVLIRKELGIIGFLLLVLFFWKVELKLSAAVDDRNVLLLRVKSSSSSSSSMTTAARTHECEGDRMKHIQREV